MNARKDATVKKQLGILGIIAVCATLSATAFIATASAHAELASSSPAADSVIAASPATVTLNFIEEIQHTAGSYGLAVKNASGQSVTAGAPKIGADSMSLSVALKPDLPGGTYTVVWSNLSTDGDALTDESFSFSIGGASSAPGEPSAAATPHTHTHDDMPSTEAANAGPATTGAIVTYAMAMNDSGIDGRVELTPLEGGKMTQVGVFLNGVLEGSSHMAHIHIASTCFEGAHAADLDNIVATASGYGRSVTMVDLPFSILADGKHNVLVHAGPDSSSAANGRVVACAVIPAQPAAPATAALPKSLPSTGSAGSASNNSATLMSLAALALAGTLIAASGITAVRRGR
jgi:methionine-rich copper-binding protein CopC